MIELLAVIVIILILALLFGASYSKIGASVAKAKCISNLRALQAGFESYVSDKGMWPQLPVNTDVTTAQTEDMWFAIMDPYLDNSREVWLCPVLKALRLKGTDGSLLRMHYVPTRFDANRISPHRWPVQPWFIEVGNAHGTGPLIMFTDGSIKSLQDFFNK